MPYTITIHPATRSAVQHLSGAVDGQEIITICRKLFTHPDWEAGFSTLWDLRAIETLLLVPEDIQAFAAEAPAFATRRGPGRSAFVTGDPWIQINALLLGIKSRGDEKRECRVFSHLSEAEAWLAEGAVMGAAAQQAAQTP